MIFKCPFCGSIKKPKSISPYPIKLVKCQDCGKISAERKFIKYTNTDKSSQKKGTFKN